MKLTTTKPRPGDTIREVIEANGPTPRCYQVERPEPPKPKLPTTPGTVGVATVRGVPGVRVQRQADGSWTSVDAVPHSPGHLSTRHGDMHIKNFQELHVLTDEELAEVGYAHEQIAAKELLKEIEDFALGVHDSYQTGGEYRLGARSAARTIVYRLADYLRALREESK